MNSMMETIATLWEQVSSYIIELFRFIYYGIVEWWRVDGSAWWAKVQILLLDTGVPVWVAYLAATVLFLFVLGLLIKIFRRRPKPVAPPKEAPKQAEVITKKPEPAPLLPSTPRVTTTPLPEPVVTTTPAPVIEEPETVTLPPTPVPITTPSPVKKISFSTA